METHVGKKINDETHIHITLFRSNHSKSLSKTSASGEWEHCWDDFGMFQGWKKHPLFFHHCSSRYKSCGRSTSPMGVPPSWGYPERDGWLVYFMENPSYKWDDDWLPIGTLILGNLYIHLNSIYRLLNKLMTLSDKLRVAIWDDQVITTARTAAGNWKPAAGWFSRLTSCWCFGTLVIRCYLWRSVAVLWSLASDDVGWCWMMLVVRGWIQSVQNHGISPLWFPEEFPGTSQPRKGHPKGLEKCDNLSRHVEGMCILR